jgi:aldose 1-epimerase
MGENYPGDLSVQLTYTLSEENELIIEYQANSSEDTIVNLTHHSYFNLDGHKSIY